MQSELDPNLWPAAASSDEDPAHPANPAPTRPVQARLAHLFRDALRAGRIHPLQQLVERYRLEHPL